MMSRVERQGRWREDTFPSSHITVALEAWRSKYSSLFC
jgi:hypothetical protein